MTRQKAKAQSAAYRKAAKEYSAAGDDFAAEQLTELANRIDDNLIAGK